MKHQAYIEYRKYRPSTSKVVARTIDNGEAQRPQTSKKLFEANPLELRTLEKNKSKFRQARPFSSGLKEKSLNKYWDEDKKVTEERKDSGIYTRNLYKLKRQDWDSMKKFNFLTNIGGIDLDVGICLPDTDTTVQKTTRPATALTTFDNFFKKDNRPMTSQMPIIHNRLNSGLPIGKAVKQAESK
jgi:hypothetical protein